MNYILSIWANPWLALLLYWLPLLMCAIHYSALTWTNYRKDIVERDAEQTRLENSSAKSGWYHPTDTVGSLIGRGLVTVIPVANLLVAVFSAGSVLFGRFFRWIGKLFDQPLVPKRNRP